MECGAGLMTAIFFIVLGEMNHSDVLVLLNKNAGVQFLTFVLNRTWRAWVECFFGVLHFYRFVRHRWYGTCVSLRLLVSDHTRLQPADFK